MSEEKALVKKDEEVLPDYIKKGDQRGTEHIKKDDMQLPRLSIAQKTSEQIDKSKPRYIAGLEFGQMFNNLTEEIYGEGPFLFSIVRADQPRGIEFYPIDEGGGIKDMNVALDDPRMKFGKEGEKPTATKFYDFVIVFWPSQEIIALSLKGTGLKVARELNTLVMLRNCPLFAGKYSISSAIKTDKKGTYGIHLIKRAGFCTKEEYAFAEEMFESIKDKELVIEREPGTDEGEVIDATPF
jgi:hypothetical protein